MARYDYRCAACGTVFEVEHGMTEHPVVTCPTCGSAADKVFSASGIVFEGSGFYNTDQRGRGSSTKTSAGSKSNDKAADTAPKDNAASGTANTSDASTKKATPQKGVA